MEKDDFYTVEHDYYAYDPDKHTYAQVESPSDAGFVMISMQEYYGFQKCLRVIHDRALQQIDRATADENGYSIIQAMHQTYSREDNFEFYRIKKNTPYSLNLSLAAAYTAIKADLIRYYHYVDLPTLEYTTRSGQLMSIKVTPKILAKRIPFLNDESTGADEKVLYEWWKSVSDHISFDISVVSGNYGQGVYAVTYWATDLI